MTLAGSARGPLGLGARRTGWARAWGMKRPHEPAGAQGKRETSSAKMLPPTCGEQSPATPARKRALPSARPWVLRLRRPNVPSPT